MAKIEIIIGQFENDGEYNSVIALLKTQNEDFVLESEILYNENDADDLKTIDHFINRWQKLSQAENFSLEIKKDVEELKLDLEAKISWQKENEEEQQRRDEKNGLYPDKWDYAN